MTIQLPTWELNFVRGSVRTYLNPLLSILPLSKKACSKPTPIPPPMPAPQTTVVAVTPKSNEKPPSTDDISYHETKRPFVVPKNFSKKSFECMNSFSSCPKPAYVPNWDEIHELLNHTSSFIERKLPVQNMGMLFSATQLIQVEIDENPSQSFIARLLYLQTPLLPVFSIWRTTHLLKQQKW